MFMCVCVANTFKSGRNDVVLVVLVDDDDVDVRHPLERR